MDNFGSSIEDLLKQKKTSTQKPSSSTSINSVSETFEEKMKEIEEKAKEKETQQQAMQQGVEYVDLKGFPISPEALNLLTEKQVEEQNAVVFLFNGPELRLGSTHPSSEQTQHLLHQLMERHKTHGVLYHISERSLLCAKKLYKNLPKIHVVRKGISITEKSLQQFQDHMQTYQDIDEIIKNASVTDIITILMAAALKFGTSDVHIEAEERDIIVRYRIDGVLQDVGTLPYTSWKKMISRIKLVSGLKINITDHPQDGRFTIFMEEGDTDVRVSTIPTSWGESVVMRVLKPSAINVEFTELGYRPLIEKKLLKEIEKPHGMILTTGPTGSGKTTTLYAILKKLNTPERKVITLEDPIEYKLEGINQSQIDHTKDYTFAAGLRSILRQDPDIVMVGEIRDLETAEVAINAALTGHLMLSTLHTNDAAGAIPRFISMGVKAFLLAPALNAIIGQRLARKVCEKCKEGVTLTSEELELVKKVVAQISPASGEKVAPESEWKFYKGRGCEICNGTGYK